MNAKKNELAPAPKRPAPVPAAPEKTVKELIEEFNSIRKSLENYAIGLRPLDRRRLKGVGIVTLGFIERAFELAAKNPGALPEYTPIEKFQKNYAAFADFHTLLDLCRQIEKTLWNVTLVTANIVLEDSLDFYGAVKNGAIKGINAYETIYNELFQFFKKTKRDGAAPTQKEVLRDAKALIDGKKDGEMIIRNVRPKLTKGEHKVIDMKYDDSAQFKEEFTTNHANGHELKN